MIDKQTNSKVMRCICVESRHFHGLWRRGTTFNKKSQPTYCKWCWGWILGGFPTFGLCWRSWRGLNLWNCEPVTVWASQTTGGLGVFFSSSAFSDTVWILSIRPTNFRGENNRSSIGSIPTLTNQILASWYWFRDGLWREFIRNSKCTMLNE